MELIKAISGEHTDGHKIQGGKRLDVEFFNFPKDKCGKLCDHELSFYL